MMDMVMLMVMTTAINMDIAITITITRSLGTTSVPIDVMENTTMKAVRVTTMTVSILHTFQRRNFSVSSEIPQQMMA
jgi:hypothetical protein